MRSAAVTGLLALATGCSWVYGLETPVPIDGVKIDPSTVVLRQKLVHFVGGAIKVDDVPINPPPKIELGAISDIGMPLTTARIDPEGNVAVPVMLLGKPWRLVYTIPGEALPHEIQWSVTGGKLYDVRFDPARTAVPANSGYSITVAAALNAPQIMTTGVWTQSDASHIGANAQLVFSSALSMFGPLRAPDPVLGDRVVLCDFDSVGVMAPDVRTNGCAVMELGLTAGTLSSPATMPPWATTTTLVKPSGPANSDPSSPNNRLTLALGPLYRTPTKSFAYEVGYAPSLQAPGFARTTPDATEVTDATRPVFLSFARLSGGNAAVVFPPGVTTPEMPKVVYAYGKDQRTVHGVPLISAIQSLTELPGSAQGSVTIAYPAALPTLVKLAEQSLTLDDDSTTDKAVLLPGATATLSWTPDAIGGAHSDDYLVTLYELGTGTIKPVRTWQTTTTSLVIDTTLIATGKSYVFELAGRAGFPDAGAAASYERVTYPFGWSSMFASAFTRP